jgi:hypothetical protein
MKEKTFEEGLKFPWGKAKRLWNILWILIPILGYFAIIGYTRKIILGLSKGNTKELPIFGNFWDNLKEGFMIFIYFIPTIIALMLIAEIPIIGEIIYWILTITMLPILMINLYVKNEFKAIWELEKVFKMVFKNFADYLMALLKTIGYGIIYIIGMIVLVGIPCYIFGMMYYLVDFYKRN